jgi:hypothetical protein
MAATTSETSAASRYTVVPKTLERLLNQIPSLGRPDKVNSAWLGQIGMGGGNNQSMIRVLKGLGAVSNDGSPSDLWAALRGKDRVKIGAAVRRMYADLFSVYPNAHEKDDEALTSFFRSTTDLGDKAQRLSVQTFKVLCKFGDLSAGAAAEALGEEPDGVEEEAVVDAPAKTKPSRRSVATGSSVALTVNLQLQLPASADGEVYEKLFAAMAKHLKGLIDAE